MDNIYNLTLSSLEEYFLSLGDKKFRATQVFDWLYKKRITSFDEMVNIKKELLEVIKQDFTLKTVTIEQRQIDEDVEKYLFHLEDNEKIEAVLMLHDYGNSICVSSQVGCNMGCQFCESGRRKKVRNLKAGEMIQQILLVEEASQKKITHIVIMGIGEPFDNYLELVKFIELCNHPKALEIGSRHITVSTCGIVPKILEFASLPYQANLAISLHASNDETRSKLMPINKVYPIKDLMESIKEYLKITNRRVSFEYILLDGVNDKEDDAIELSNLLKGINAYVNLIPYNETNHLKWKRSSKIAIAKFYDILKQNHTAVTIRREFGSKISAACGQLRSEKEDK